MAKTKLQPIKPDTDETEEVLPLCVGPTLTDGDVPALKFIPVTQEDYDTATVPVVETLVFATKAFKPSPYPGVVKRFKFVKGAHQIYAASGQYVGLWKDEAQRRVWEAERKTFEVTQALKAAEKKGKEDSALEEPIAQLREVYRKLLYPRKAAFIAHLLASLTR